MPHSTDYITTDLDLYSPQSFHSLRRELERQCLLLHYHEHEERESFAVVECILEEESPTAEQEITQLLDVIVKLNSNARKEWNNCSKRVLNLGFRTGDNSRFHAYKCDISESLVRQAAVLGCSIEITIYSNYENDKNAH
ncbi:hypothetical protein Pla110_11180 [Polystyrenella longa]|uniref:DUF4279 domain-containing protein n=1 Tax=Polystyrenella longa TaxID=2528007 RepID=A0A518CJJ6_9PLAN|nr:hypothetical protein [Polystyrenella longa]QDU79408.1 hypothetical protein Pla110_11180 [Polystyrenella longa]